MNPELVKFYQEQNSAEEKGNGITVLLSDYSIREPAVDAYGDSLLENAKAFSDTAVVVFGRTGGEGADMPMDMAAYEGGTAGRHYMELSENEEALLAMLEQNFSKVIVLINSSSPMELGFWRMRALMVRSGLAVPVP